MIQGKVVRLLTPVEAHVLVGNDEIKIDDTTNQFVLTIDEDNIECIEC